MRRKQSQKTSRQVYVIEAENGLVKIGSTANIAGRLKTLRTGSPIPLRLAYFSAPLVNAFRVEYAAQVSLWEHHTAGEWFAVEPSVAIDAVLLAEKRVGKRPPPQIPRLAGGHRLEAAAMYDLHGPCNADTPNHASCGMPEADLRNMSIRR